MSDIASLDDLRLVAAISRTGSVGAAARDMRLSQPSASQRLARLERRCGVMLFERDRRGARPTPSGEEMTRQANALLVRLEGVVQAVRDAGAARRLRVSTFPSMASTLFPVLEELMPEVPLEQHVDHGGNLVLRVNEGTLDAAFVAIADRLTLPRGTTARVVGRDRLTCFLPRAVAPPPGTRHPFRDTEVVYVTYDLGADSVHARLAALGAIPRRAATSDTVLATARRQGMPAVIPRSATIAGLRAGERVVDLPFTMSFKLSLVTGRKPDQRLTRVLPAIREMLALGG